MVLDVQDALVIASLMMGGDGRNLSNLQLDDLTLSAIAEAMNQMCGRQTACQSGFACTRRPINCNRYHNMFSLFIYSTQQNGLRCF